MSETVLLPSTGNAGLVTGGHNDNKGLYDLLLANNFDNASRFNLNAIHETSAISRENSLKAQNETVAAVKDHLYETSKMVSDVKNHVTAENASVKQLILEHSHRHETLVRTLENARIIAELQDAKDEISALKIKANATVAI